ncbi:hypothetical protein Pmani_000719 [Petrolisthes manimaculis]|uniref:Uncharacterized protein n=1 Tax=Petrolisthes manimaculis TaxID=1843537 RepID=A0AAE1UQ27_9EUCA|nr:hypothetical protein Pmani_000719 [Petrolisthes manimaculis]
MESVHGHPQVGHVVRRGIEKETRTLRCDRGRRGGGRLGKRGEVGEDWGGEVKEDKKCERGEKDWGGEDKRVSESKSSPFLNRKTQSCSTSCTPPLCFRKTGWPVG